MTNSPGVTTRLLRHHDLLADPSVLNLFYAIGIDGSLDANALHSAFLSLLQYYPILGAAGDDGHDVLAVHDFSGGAAAETERALAALIATERKRSHNTHSGLLVRVTLARLLPAKHLLLLSFHHAAADGWSLALYAAHVSRAYEALLRGVPIQHPVQPPVSRNVRLEERAERDRATLRAELTVLRHEAVDPFGGRRSVEKPPLRWSSMFDADFVERLQLLSASHRVTVFSIVVSAIAQQLQQMFRLSDLVLGTIVLGRRSSAEMAEGGASYQGALLVLRGPAFDLGGVGAAVSAAAARVLDYEEQLSCLSTALGGHRAAEPAVFVLADAHPMSGLRLQDAHLSVVLPSACIAADPRPAHSPNCGRIALFWRQGTGGASLNVFAEPALAPLAQVLQEGVLRILSRWTGAAPKEQAPVPWFGSLVGLSAPIAEAVSPVRLPFEQQAMCNKAAAP